MNDNKIQNIFLKMKAEKLSESSRERIRQHLLWTMKEKPIPTYREFSFMRFVWVSGTRRAVVGVLAVFVLVFSGVSYAAENALPGDSLYTLKTGFNEPVRLALAVSSKAKANYEAELTERRLSEVSALALEDNLDEIVGEELLAQALEHATSLRIRLDKTSDDFDEADAVKLASRLESSRKIRNELSARVAPQAVSVSAMRAVSVESQAAPTAMMMVVETPSPTTPSVQEDGQADSIQTVALKSVPVALEMSENPSQRQLNRVEEEYEKALSILAERVGKISKEKGSRIYGGVLEEKKLDSRRGTGKLQD